MFGWDDAIGIGASLLGGMMGDDAASDAAQAQAAATDRANERLERQYQQTRSDLTPYRNLGTGAVNALSTYLGFGGGGGGAAVDRNAIRARLLPQFTSGGGASGVPAHLAGLPPEVLAGLGYGQWSGGPGLEQGGIYSQGGPTAGAVDEAALNAAIDAEVASMSAGQGDANDPNFGYLLQNFTGKDLQNEPGYKFGLSEGMKGVDRSLQRGGMMFSGAALKAAQRFGQDYAGTKFNDAFNRDSANKTRIYNFLSGAVGTGQNAAAGTGQAGANMAGQVASNTVGMGNAQGAARIAGGNAMTGGIMGGIDNWQQNKLLERITGGNAGWLGDPSRLSGNGMPSWYGQ
jgi:hypothetical protein